MLAMLKSRRKGVSDLYLESVGEANLVEVPCSSPVSDISAMKDYITPYL